ncbi:hypothetical protein [Candidatus Similichlamydia epinepheli]|uniref:hypothetical protein n=1 Tax=Candidatus Similichlamydia epinepheli TaxID=1903953 RepID=UPI000D39158D|nr:hypothetical protein [Candidatus Similichlamydia epinepheli]
MNSLLEKLTLQAFSSPREELSSRLTEILKTAQEIDQFPIFSSRTSELAWSSCFSLIFQDSSSALRVLRQFSSHIDLNRSDSKLFGPTLNEIIRESTQILQDSKHHPWEEIAKCVRSILRIRDIPSLPIVSPIGSFTGWITPKKSSEHSFLWIDECTISNLQHIDGFSNPVLVFPKSTTLLHAFSIEGNWFQKWSTGEISVLVLDHSLLLQCEAQKLTFSEGVTQSLIIPNKSTFWLSDGSSILDNPKFNLTYPESLEQDVKYLRDRVEVIRQRLLQVLHKSFHPLFAMLEYKQQNNTHEHDIFCTLSFCNTFWNWKDKKRPLEITKKIPRVVHIIDDQSGDEMQLLRILLEYRNKNQKYATAVASLELSTLCSGNIKISSQKNTTFLSFLQKNKIGYAVANASLKLEESIEDVLDRVLRVSPDLIVFHNLNPISLSIAERIEGPKKLLFIKSVEKGMRLPFDKIISIFGIEEGQNRILIPPPLQQREKSFEKRGQVETFGQPLRFHFLASTFINEPLISCGTFFGEFLKDVLERCPGLHLAVFGSPSKHELNRFFDSRLWQERVHFPQTKKEKSDLLTATSIYLNPFPIGSQDEAIPFLMNGQPIFQLKSKNFWHTREVAAQSLGQEETIFTSTEKYIQKIQEVYESPSKLFKISQRQVLKSFIIYEPAWYTMQVEREIEDLLSFN